jgi:hypothetical protein
LPGDAQAKTRAMQPEIDLCPLGHDRVSLLAGVDAFPNATLQNINRERDGVLFDAAARGSDLHGVFVQIVLLFFYGAEIK